MKNIIYEGYQIFQNGQPIGKQIPPDERRASIRDLEVGGRYTFDVVPVTTKSKRQRRAIGSEGEIDQLLRFRVCAIELVLVSFRTRIAPFGWPSRAIRIDR